MIRDTAKATEVKVIGQSSANTAAQVVTQAGIGAMVQVGYEASQTLGTLIDAT